ncbi:intradiol ring-cleavage dioxygenase [Polymorphospora sp. NPDC050346]|uniref:intradiol ring-cleavage dioxygenase n=1 Tax=Polymorphospora sp. NPDC050346 TaxID=3155780 RepID=UPI0033D0666B
MTYRIDRRRALAGIGTVGLGTLLTACGGGRTAGPTTSAEVTTSAGTTATVQPQTGADPALADLFDDAASCVVTPEQTEGPYYFDPKVIRSDIREDRPGMRLRLAVRVREVGDCAPVPNAAVDIWHCDAGGLYSGFESASTGSGGPPGRGGTGRTDDEIYLRGAQVTNADGIVEFVTVYPGWYRGRTVHIHTKVHLDTSTTLTTQFYFDEAVSAQVYATEPYSSHAGRDTTNERDGVMRSGGDPPPMLTLSRDGDGYLGLITIGVDR